MFLKNIDSETRKNTFFILLTYFLVLFSYPLVRSSTGTLFYEFYTASDYSLASFIGVAYLILMIFINNKLQSLMSIQKVYIFTGLITLLGFIGSYYLYQSGFKSAAFALFAIKESYIVLLVHLCLAYANTFYSKDLFKRIIGPIGAMGSVGGILGGLLTSFLAKKEGYGTEFIFIFSLVLIVMTVIIFSFSQKIRAEENIEIEKKKSNNPLMAIGDVKKYVFLIASIVMLSQFVIFIADLQFNIIFVKTVLEKNARTAYLGNFYSLINGVSLILQFIVLPLLLIRFKTRNIFMFVPLMYLVLIFGGLGFGAGQILIIGAVFIIMKGTDYSIFSIAKEVMYHPLGRMQKYGAKYITDMFIYRLSKALIAFVMAQAVLKSLSEDMVFLSALQFVFLSLWIALVFKLFKEEKKLKFNI